MSALTSAATTPEVAALVANVRLGDAKARVEAVSTAPRIGSQAVEALAAVYRDGDPGAIRAAGDCIRRIAHNAARPGAPAERGAVLAVLAASIGPGQPRQLRVDALYLIGLIGGDSETTAVAAQLADLEIRENARLALQRIPGSGADRALQKAWLAAGEDYRPSIEQSLRARFNRRRRR